MELALFVEEDMRNFLDGVLSERNARVSPSAHQEAHQKGILSPEELALYSPSRDYAKELDVALHDRDYSRAERIIRDLKESFDNAPPGSPEKGEVKRLLELLYAKFREALQKRPGVQEGELFKELRAFIPAGESDAVPLPPVSTEVSHDGPVSTGEPVATTVSATAAASSETQLSPSALERPSPQSPSSPSSSAAALASSPSSPSSSAALASSPLSPSSSASSSASSSSSPPSEVVTDSLATPVTLDTPSPTPQPAKGPKGLSEAEERALLADLEEIATLIKERSYAPAMHAYHDVRERLKAERLTPVQRARILGRLRLLFSDILEGFQEEQRRGREPATSTGTTLTRDGARGATASSPLTSPPPSSPPPSSSSLSSSSLSSPPVSKTTSPRRLPAQSSPKTPPPATLKGPEVVAAFEREASNAERAFRGRALGGAMRHYHAARQLYQQLPLESRGEAYERLFELYGAIASVKNAHSTPVPQTPAAPPRASTPPERNTPSSSAPSIVAPQSQSPLAPRQESGGLLENEERRLGTTRP